MTSILEPVHLLWRQREQECFGAGLQSAITSDTKRCFAKEGVRPSMLCTALSEAQYELCCATAHY